MQTDRATLLVYGEQLLLQWCTLNAVSPPEIKAWYTDVPFDACAYYRDNVIQIWPNECARVGVSARQWSYPGYVVDRTPYGVLQHELGHHVDEAFEYRGGVLSTRWRRETGEEQLTNYCTNDMEWFAEIFRLFVTNPDLLRLLRPISYTRMIERWPARAETRTWPEVLMSAHPRWYAATLNKIKNVRPVRQGELQL